MDNTHTKSDSLTDTGGEITFKGWNIPNSEKIILEELKEYYEDYDILNFEIINKKEHAYACSKYDEEMDANDEGYSYWIFYEDTYKKGLGKCTTFIIKYILKEKQEATQDGTTDGIPPKPKVLGILPTII